MEEIFTPDNTVWEFEDGHSYLVYDGSLEELSKETGKTEDELVELLGEYEDQSRDLHDQLMEIEDAKKGNY